MRDLATEHARVTARTPAGAKVEIDLSVGHIRQLVLCDIDRAFAPLHRAPWADGVGYADLWPVERHLSCEFFCAPFGDSDIEAAPPHGWPANSGWDAGASRSGALHLTLRRRVQGARIEKDLRLAPDAPLLYQRHRIVGGSGMLNVAHHPMVHLRGTGRFATSPKRAIVTHPEPLDAGANRLRLAASGTDIAAVPAVEGTQVDLTRLPIADRHEDFVVLVEEDLDGLGWSAITRDAEDDIVFFLKRPGQLPVTMLWHSNGGRSRAPWDGRHRGVLGVEDGCSAGALGHAASVARNAVSDLGVPTALLMAEGRIQTIIHVVGVIARPDNWDTVTDIRIEGDCLILTGDTGDTRSMPFNTDFFTSGDSNHGRR